MNPEVWQYRYNMREFNSTERDGEDVSRDGEGVRVEWVPLTQPYRVYLRVENVKGRYGTRTSS